MDNYKLTLIFEGGNDPLTGELLPTEIEEVIVPAENLRQARNSVMIHARINPRGRLLRIFDEKGVELFMDI